MILCISPDRLPGNAVLQLWPRRVPERGVPAQRHLAQVGCHPSSVCRTMHVLLQLTMMLHLITIYGMLIK